MSRAMKPNSPPGQILCRIDAGVAHVTLSHPGRMNAMTVAMWRQLREVFEALGADAALRCVVVAGAEGHFAAGADIREFPALARIEGVCVGGGLEIAAQCDLRIAAES
ncbi:enoyl-CoA hydratase/isomerase family protein, partial [Bordetella pertussis]|uniref:enoyl-CoA hydratase/isomerase family protein n=1 Tax=Bordetella pertussis TaxID=520 RepID=UPI000A7BB8AA